MDKWKNPYTDGVATIISVLKKHEVDINKALEYGRNSHSFDDIVHLTLAGKFLFYPLPKSVMLCETYHAPQQKVYNCFLCAGDLEELMTEGQKIVMSEARRLGCTLVSLTGRPGWKPTLEKHGWENTIVTMYKEIDYEHEQDEYPGIGTADRPYASSGSHNEFKRLADSRRNGVYPLRK